MKIFSVNHVPATNNFAIRSHCGEKVVLPIGT